MKKFILVLSLVSVLFLAGCNSDDNITNGDIQGNNDNQQNVEISGNTTDNQNAEVSGNNDTLIQSGEIASEEAKDAILNSLKDSEWVKENVTMEQTCFGEEFTGEQELTFEKLSDDLVIVQAFSYEENNFGAQVFLIGYKDGKVQVISMPEDTPSHPGHGGYAIDSENLVLRSIWAHQGGLNYTDYKIGNLAFEEINSISFASEDEYDEEALNKFEKSYNTHAIENKLTEANLDSVYSQK